MRHWTFGDWVGYACLFVAAICIAADTGIKGAPNLAARMPEFFRGEFWAFLPITLVLLGTAVLVASSLGLIGASRSTASTPRATKQHFPMEAIPSAERQGRIFVGESITPDYLTSFFIAHTALQANWQKRMSESGWR